MKDIVKGTRERPCNSGDVLVVVTGGEGTKDFFKSRLLLAQELVCVVVVGFVHGVFCIEVVFVGHEIDS